MFKLDKGLYAKNEYINRNPSLHQEDSSWKVSKITPLIMKAMKNIDKEEINLLDIGGGAGQILKMVSKNIEDKHDRKVNNFALDLSPGILEIQKENNPGLKCLNEDICNNSLKDKEIDIILMIDVLEHIPNDDVALKELRRIFDFAILKVPLENNMYSKLLTFLKRNKSREQVGHINFYTLNELKSLISNNGEIVDLYFTNVFKFYRSSEYYKKRLRMADKLINIIGDFTIRVFPRMCSLLFMDFVMILVKY